MKYKINMLSRAGSVKGQGVGSAYEEQVTLVREGMSERFDVTINKFPKATITHYHTVNFSFFLSIPFAKHYGTTVGYVHFLPETMEQSLKLPRFAKKVFYKYLLTFYNSMDHLVTVNPYFIDRLADYGVDKKKVSYIPNFVSEKDFYPVSPERKRAIRAEFGLNPDQFTAICAGQLQTRKGIFDFVKVAEAMPDIQFVWAGGFSFGKITDGYEKIQEIVENPPANVKFTGIVDRERMNDIYNMGDVMFLPSYDELFPMTILEAMNCNIPLLLRDIPIYDNILFDYYLRETDNEGFANALRRLKDDPAYYKRAAADSWRGHEFYNRDHVLHMWDEFYTGLVAERDNRKIRAEQARANKAARKAAKERKRISA